MTNSEESNQIVTVDEQTLYLWDIGESPKEKSHYSIPSNDKKSKIYTGGWSPLHPEIGAVSADHSIFGVDFRQKRKTFEISAHLPFVRTIDFNSNKDYTLLSGGDDGLVKIWDTRSPEEPLKVFHGHGHWITAVSYNKHHDQFFLSASTDHSLFLWHAPSLSSEKKTRSEGERILKKYNEHDESIYSVAWSGWWFASASWDGRVVVNRVPSRMIEMVLDE